MMAAGHALTAGSQKPAGELVVNGRRIPWQGTSTVGGLLQRLDVKPERVVVELNGEIFKRGEGMEAPLNAGDRVELVHFVGGG